VNTGCVHQARAGMRLGQGLRVVLFDSIRTSWMSMGCSCKAHEALHGLLNAVFGL